MDSIIELTICIFMLLIGILLLLASIKFLLMAINNNTKYNYRTSGTIIEYSEVHDKIDFNNKDTTDHSTTIYIPTVEYTDDKGNIIRIKLDNERLNESQLKKFYSNNNQIELRYSYLDTKQARLIGGYNTNRDIGLIVAAILFLYFALTCSLPSILIIITIMMN
jgi:hypothetical protein